MTAAIGARMDGALFGAYPTPHAPSPHMERGTGGRSERQRQAALPGDIVLGLVEAVAVELVDEVATLGADADAAEAVLEPCAEVASELGPGVAGVELMHADRASDTWSKFAGNFGAGLE